ncbi:MAG: GNAT family N-acetyltransferase [Candidatus Dormibacteria bacterium]
MELQLTIRAATPADDVPAWVGGRWGGKTMAAHGRLYEIGQLDALVATVEDRLVGALTYFIEDDALEIVSCGADPLGRGVGRALVDAAVSVARLRSLRRVWATTTNDNLTALGFWQAVGFHLTALRPGAVSDARRLKSTIPERGCRGLLIRDEIDVEMTLDQSGTATVSGSSPWSQAVWTARTMSFGYDGDGGLGDRLVAAVLSGAKTATSSLAVEYLSGETLPRVGERLALVDHRGRRRGTVETTRVTIVALSEVGDDIAHDEGEGFAGAGEWRKAHEAFWHQTTDMIRADARDPDWRLRSNEPVVVEWFRLLEQAQDTDT